MGVIGPETLALARLFESLPLTCPNCGADMRLIAFITDAAPIERTLTHIGLNFLSVIRRWDALRPLIRLNAGLCAALGIDGWRQSSYQLLQQKAERQRGPYRRAA